jgi:hypothetical protein
MTNQYLREQTPDSRNRVSPHDRTEIRNNHHSMKKIEIGQFSELEKLARLIHIYLELRLPLTAALRAAKADLQMASLHDTTQQVSDQVPVFKEQSLPNLSV